MAFHPDRSTQRFLQLLVGPRPWPPQLFSYAACAPFQTRSTILTARRYRRTGFRPSKKRAVMHLSAHCFFNRHRTFPQIFVIHTPLLYRLLACSIVLYFVRRWVMGCLDWIGARGRVGRSCLGWRALLDKHRWHCLVERDENTPLSALDVVIEFDMAK